MFIEKEPERKRKVKETSIWKWRTGMLSIPRQINYWLSLWEPDPDVWGISKSNDNQIYQLLCFYSSCGGLYFTELLDGNSNRPHHLCPNVWSASHMLAGPLLLMASDSNPSLRKARKSRWRKREWGGGAVTNV